MNLSKEVLKIDSKIISIKLENFIKEKLTELNRNGIIVPISGGLDSSVVTALCVNAIGKDNVIGLMLPEKEGNPEAKFYSKKLINFLGIEEKEIDISRALKVLGTYDFVLSKIPTRFLKGFAVKKFISSSKTNPFLQEIKGKGKGLISNGMATFYVKNRIRFVFAYKFAEENNLMLVGCAHKSEDLTGLFAKFGVDDLADIMPLKNLFRSQILQLAEHLKIPKEIIERTPNPDIIPGVKDKYKDILGLESEKLDLILWGLEKNLSCENISKLLELPEQKVSEIKDLMQITAYMRNHSLAPSF